MQSYQVPSRGQGEAGTHTRGDMGDTWVSATWVMHDARGVYGSQTSNVRGVRSYQVPSKAQGEAGYARGRMKCAWGCMGQIQQDPRGMHALHSV